MAAFLERRPEFPAHWPALICTLIVAGAGATIACVDGNAQSQSPGQRAQPADQLQSLQLLLTEGVYSVQNLQSGARADAPGKQDPPAPPTPAPAPQGQPRPEVREGTSAARLLANIRDARFDREGHLRAFLVEPPVVDPRGEQVLRVLPANAVRWDDARHQWVVIEPNLQFAELQAVDAVKPETPAPGTATREPLLLASRLVRATLDPKSGAGPVPLPAPSAEKPPEAREGNTAGEGKAGDDKREPKPPVIWFAPTAQRLALVVVPIAVSVAEAPSTVKHVPLPWSLVRATPSADGVQLNLATKPETLATAPACGDAAERPLAALRQRCYEHFGVAVPAWDRAPETAREAAK
jgi:hypothetical protein